MTRRTLVSSITAVLALGAAAGAHFTRPSSLRPPVIAQAAVTRGDIVDTVLAVGTVDPSRAIQIGAQVSGIVSKLYVDFDSRVTKGEVLAEIDSDVSRAALDAAKAALDRAGIDLDGHRATLTVDEDELRRVESLVSSGLATQQDLDDARLTVSQDRTQVEEDGDAVKAAQSNVDTAQLDMDHCKIISPIDGVVIARNVDVGQAVASRMEAPIMFVLGSNLETIDVVADVDESDVGRLRPGQEASFTVESYPNTTFHGRVKEARVNAVSVVANVVTYEALITASNPDLRLLPGMTASVTIQTAEARDVLRVPTAALRLVPAHEVFSALGQPAPVVTRPGSAAAADTGGPVPSASDVPAPQTMGTRPSAPALGPAPKTASAIDQMFAPMAAPRRVAQAWELTNGHLQAVKLTVGMSDGKWTQVLDGSLTEGEQVVISARPADPK